MEFVHSDKVKALQEKVGAFMDAHIYPNEERYEHEVASGDRWQPSLIMEDLKVEARQAGLWNLFLPGDHGAGLTNLEYAPLCEIMGRSKIASEAFNCSAPDTGNMETLALYGTEAQKKQWLEPLLEGHIRSAFAMTEPAVASSDATNIESSIVRDGDHYVLNGRKWWTTGAPNPHCKILIFMGKTDARNPDRHRQQSMVLVPRDTPGVTVLRSLPMFGYDDAPHGHGEVLFENVRVPADNILLGEGRGFEIAQGRLGPGRIHHCMRAIGAAERTLEKMCKRVKSRVAFGKPISQQTVTLERIAEARIMIEQARLLVLKAAYMMDTVGNKVARAEIAMIKVAVPTMLTKVTDMAIQAFGGAGVSDDFGLAYTYAAARSMRIYDGPDEVHRNQIGKLELDRYN
ncbi:MAG: acyl-CoA dehydrogenase [Reyranella sp.]|nr:acyl-CoA dehydrogenase [Reyranella sp.]